MYRTFVEDITATQARREVERCFVVSNLLPEDANRRTILYLMRGFALARLSAWPLESFGGKLELGLRFPCREG